jgi:transcriptional antiterminator RfaH
MRWVVVQVKSKSEEAAIKNLKESGFNCFCPYLTTRRGTKINRRPMFTGYIFVEINLLDMPVWRTISSHRGVIKILMLTSGCPGTLPTGLVEGLIEQGDLLEDFNEVIKMTKGQKIRFTAGPLCGMNGIVHWTNRERIALLVDLLGLQTIVQSTTNLVTPIE